MSGKGLSEVQHQGCEQDFISIAHLTKCLGNFIADIHVFPILVLKLGEFI